MTLPATSSAVLATRDCGPEALVWRDDLPVPRPGAGEVLVRVGAAGVNATGINARVGCHGTGKTPGCAGAQAFPRIQGSDLSVRVVALGEGVADLPIGAQVICRTNRHEPSTANPQHFVAIGSEYCGTFAQYCIVPARHLHAASASALTTHKMGAMPCACGTAWNLLSRAIVAVGERVLVTGASGGVGLAAVRLAILRGAEVSGQCALGKASAVRAAGASVLDSDATPDPRSFDVVIDVVGGAGWQARLEALRPGGRYATSGVVGGPLAQGDLRTIHLNDLTLFGCTHQPREVFAGLVTLINTARIRPVVSNNYPLRELAQAQADPAKGRYAGKLALIPEASDP